MDRRSFTRKSLAGGAGAVLGMSPFGSSATTTMTPPEGKYVDMHTHITQEWGARNELTAGALVQWMDANDVAQAVVLPLESPEAWSSPITTDYVLRETAPYRERLIPFCYLDPRTVSLGGRKGMVEQLQKYADAGARGFGEHKPGIPIDDPRNMEVYRACADVGLPVLFHLDSMRNMDEPGLPGLENVLQEISDIPFIGHAHGFWASISADAREEDFHSYPERSVKPGGALDRLMEEYPHLYGDLSAGSGHNAISRDLEFGREFIIRRQDQLVFGTDYLQPVDPREQIRHFKLYGETLSLPPDVEEKVFRRNARTMLGLG